MTSALTLRVISAIAALATIVCGLAVVEVVSAPSASASLWTTCNNNPAVHSGTPDTTYSCVSNEGYNSSTLSNGWPWSHYGTVGTQNIGTPPHNCTLFAAWMLQKNGLTVDPGNWGPAANWGHVLASKTNTIPAVGAIAWYDANRSPAGSSGHVAYVAQVNAANNTVFLESDNYFGGASGYTDSGWVSATEPSGYIHIKDLSTTNNAYEGAFQANTGNLFLNGDLANANTQQGMAVSTSPAIALLSTGGSETAFQANTGDLFVNGAGGSYDTQQGMMPGTSPSIAASPNGGFRVAFQANNGDLYTYDSKSGALSTGQGMDPQSSPAIAAVSGGGYEEAFQANSHNLYVWGDAQQGNTQQGMMPGTSPSIGAVASGGFKVAFQANNGNLYTYAQNGGAASTGQGMAPLTSPAITALSTGGYEEAFQANTGNLFVYGDGGSYDTQQGMQAGTSPAIAGSSAGGFKAAFQANTGNLFTYSSTNGAADTQQGMALDTSPCIAGALGGGCTPGAHIIQWRTAPTVTGATVSGDTLTAHVGTWSATPSSYNYQWLANGTAIAGANGSTLLLGTGQVGKTIQVWVQANRTNYASGTATSASTATVTSPPPGPDATTLKSAKSSASTWPVVWTGTVIDSTTNTPLATAPVSLYFSATGTGTWTRLATANTSANGTFNLTYKASKVGYYETRFAATAGHQASAPVEFHITSFPTRAANARLNSTTCRLTLAAPWGSVYGGQVVYVQARKVGTTTWVTVAKKTTDRYGHAFEVIRPSSATDYRWVYNGTSTQQKVVSSACRIY